MVHSDDGLYDADSPEDDFYGGGDSDIFDESGSDGDAGRDVDFFRDDDLVLETNFTILTGDDIRRLMEDDIAQVVAVLSVSKADASALLRRYNWSVNRVNEEWFADEERVRKEVGLVSCHLQKSSGFSGSDEIACGICFDDLSPGNVFASYCDHPFCVDCWRSYIATAVADGPGCLNLRCPEPSCKIAVNFDAIERLATEEDRKKYFSFLFRSYVEENRKIKWCTAPGCEFAVAFEIGSENSDVICYCGNFFCWNCTEEAHRPVDCETVGKWILKNTAESENTNWILAFTKPCPKCKRPIEKGEGCMRMTCKAPCGFQFCWLCLNDWSAHGYSPCNRYNPGSDAEKQKEMAKMSIERYTHYYERWAANEKSMKKAVADLREMEGVNVVKLCEYQSLPESQLNFIVEAWKQIIECRRVLKWTYAYGFYLPEEEQTKRQFFEYLQGQAEEGLERLHQCAEKELEVYLDPEEADSPSFSDFRIKLTGLTSVTKNYFENLVRALENGLEDVDSQAVHCKNPNSKNGGAASSSSTSRNSNHTTPSGHKLVTGWKNLLAGHGIRVPTPRNLTMAGNNNTTVRRYALSDLTAMNALQTTNELVTRLKERQRARVVGFATPNSGNGPVAVGQQRLNLGNTLPIPTGHLMGMGHGLLPGTVNGVGLDPRLGRNLPNVPTTLVNVPVAGFGLGSVRRDMANWQTTKGTGSSSKAHYANAVRFGRSYGVGVNKRFRAGSESSLAPGGSITGKVGSSNMVNLEIPPVASSSRNTLLAGSSSTLAQEKRQRTSSPTEVSITNHRNGDLGSWECDLCTFMNPSSASVCTMCMYDGSANWECDKCTFVNKKCATTCEVCELPR